jgi:Tol biopolymer transport system component
VRLVDAATGETRDLARVGAANTVSSLAWSPDGRWIAAAVDGDLMRLDSETGQVVVLVGKGAFDFGAAGPAWSPDGSRIAFEHFDCGQGRPCRKALAVMAFDGSNLTILTDHAEVSPDASWSADGSWIAYRSPPVGELTSPDRLAGVSTFGLSVIRPDGSDRHLVTERVRSRAWTPDGTRLWYAVLTEFQEPSSELWAFDPATGRTEPMGSSADSIAWQPVVAGEPVPTLPPTVVESAEPSQAPSSPLPPRVADPADPRGSATGIGFDSGCTVYVYEFASASLRPIADTPHCPPTSRSTSAWAPDGSAIAVGIDQYASVIGRDGAILLDTDTGTESAYRSWSSTGQYLFEQVDGDPATLAIIRRDGSGRTTVPGSPVWSPDDRRVAVSTADGQLLVGNGDGSGLASIGAFPAPSGWSPDSTMLLFVRDGNAWIVDAEGRNEHAVTTFDAAGVTAASWSPDGRWVAVAQGTTLWIVAPDGSGLRRVGVPGTERYPIHVWSPDGARLAVPAWPNEGYTPSGTMPTYIVTVADGSVTVLDYAEDSAPVWSPDGRFLAVANTRNIESEEAIDVMNADGSGRHTIWSGESGMGQSKAWLP